MADLPIHVYDQDGKPWTIDPGMLDVAIAQGAKLMTPEQVNFERQKAASSGTLGDIVAAGSNLANQMSFGAFDPLAERFTPETFQKIQVAREANPDAAQVGNIAGFGASIATGGGVFKPIQAAGEVAANTVGKVAGQAAGTIARYGTEGALISSPLAAARFIANPDDIGEALATMGTGALVGGGFGGAIVGGKALIAKGAPAARNLVMRAISNAFPEVATTEIEGAAPKTAAELLGVPQEAVQSVQDDIQQVSRGIATNQAKKVLGFNLSQMRSAGKKFQEITGEDATDDIARYFVDNKLIDYMDSPAKLLDKTESLLRDKVGPRISGIRKQLDAAEIGYFNPQELISHLEDTVGSRLEDPLYAPLQGQYEKIIKSIEFEGAQAAKAGAPGISFQQAGKITGKLFDWSRNLKGELLTGKIVVDDARRSLTDYIDSQADEVSRLMLDSEISATEKATWLGLSKSFKAARREYAILSSAESALNDRLMRTQGNQFFTPSSGATGIIGATIGGPVGAVGGVVLNQIRQAYGANIATRWADAVDQAIRTQKFTIDKAVSGFVSGARGLDVRPKIGNALRAMFNPEKRYTDVKALEKLTENLTAITSNPSVSSNLLTGINDFVASGLPEIAAPMNQKLIQVSTYLLREIPKPMQPDPFSNHPYQPSDYELSVFNRKLRAALDPMTMVEDLRNGTLTQDSVATVKELYPKLHERVIASLIEQLGNRKRNFGNLDRFQIQMLMGGQASNLFSASAMNSFQGNFLAEQQAQKANQAAKVLSNQMKTPMTRLEERP